jgi:ABC-2 type transport system ATP-binding protein
MELNNFGAVTVILDMSVNVNQLTKIFGNQKAVDGISFSAQNGEILGFLGPNGAGKSTTMKIASCYMPPSSGSIRVGGYDVIEESLKVRKIAGYLPEHNPLYYDMYVREYLSFIASLHRIRGTRNRQRVSEMISLTGLSREQHKKIGQLSKGYKQRVGLAQAMIHDPEVLILDEPTSGLDPNQIVEIRELIRQMSRNKTVIFSTHIMQEVQALCDRILIIDQGKIVADDRVSNLQKESTGKQIIIAEFESPPDQDLFRAIDGVFQIESYENSLRIHADRNIDIRASIFKLASSMQLPLVGLKKEEDSLEQIFQSLTNKNRKE